ncbi:alkaline phosphatase D family protein [Prosthecobacter fusiformis]|uniref:alkaline phosphatase D family protein n=1 Tax=Prosthecobacter fusiformis TaxID=48464 RepID=UPI001AAFCE3B|nr:alkaline phosphatase D family protein [Prosthecobacter fusiformis]
MALTLEEEFFTHVVEWKGLSANNAYRVKVAYGKDKKSTEDERVRDAYTEGNFRTFPEADNGAAFTFMLGSCNLHSLGFIEKPDRAWMQVSSLAKHNEARFMIHAGDQIYADIPLKPQASLEHYRDKYLDAWDDCTPARKALTELPHYMILDDHEIINNFDNDLTAGNVDYQGLARVAMKVYWEFQHSHNPHATAAGFHYHYDFSYGQTQFFVMDTRYYRASGSGQMIDPVQEKALLKWLSAHKDALKFIVTSVPFVTEVKTPEADKWCDPAYDGQRGRILSHILSHGISKVVFLTGDMHSALMATLDFTDAAGSTARIYELMSSPINQITPDLPMEKQFIPSLTRKLKNGFMIHSQIDKSSFFGKNSNLMAIEVPGDGTVQYRIYRTTKSSNIPVKTGSFTP